MAYIKGIALKKQFGQNFLRDPSVIYEMLDAVELSSDSNVFEIGCGDGFLTTAILDSPISRLWVFEIDSEWAMYVRESIEDDRMEVFQENILDIDWQRFVPDAPWTLLSNLPYHIVFPIFHLLVDNRSLLKEGVVMVQEEVAQKVMKTSGRGYGFPSLYFQHFFEWKLLTKIPPTAFIPPPKVDSRLMYFKPRETLDVIPNESEFWKFIKICFRSPRRTLRNNLQQAHYDYEKVSEEILKKRAQQMSKQDLLELWNVLA